ncbi:MAG: class I SAM-dependent methyltransferase [Bacteroidales bacterium]|jgi:hypothetical protein
MKTGYIFKTILLFSALLTGLSLESQEAGSSSGFSPEIGQAGKDVVWVPTPQSLVDVMLEMAKVSSSDYLIDLGSGDGRTVISAARLGATAVGVEYNPDMVALSWKNAKDSGLKDKVKFIEGDLFETDLSVATVITMFLLPEINLRLRPRLLDLEPGTRIVSNTFSMGEWEPDHKVTTEENWNSWNTALLWIVPARVEGIWKMKEGELGLSQKFQMIEGTYKANGRSAEIRDGKLRGNTISFTINGDRYTGFVEGERISGIVSDLSGNKESEWTATR